MYHSVRLPTWNDFNAPVRGHPLTTALQTRGDDREEIRPSRWGCCSLAPNKELLGAEEEKCFGRPVVQFCRELVTRELCRRAAIGVLKFDSSLTENYRRCLQCSFQ